MSLSQKTFKEGMVLLPDDPFPNFYCQTTMGNFNFHDYIKNSYVISNNFPLIKINL